MMIAFPSRMTSFFKYDVMFPYVNTWEGDVFVWDYVKTFGNTSPWAM